MSETTFYPEGGDDTISGYVGEVITTGHPNWDAIHDDTVGSEAGTEVVQVYLNWFSSGHRIRKGLTYFDTSSLGATVTIDSAVYSLYGYEKQNSINPTGQEYISVVQVKGDVISSDTTITTADFNKVGDATDDPTEGIDSGDRITGTAWNATGYNNFDLNSTGLGWIMRSGEASPSGATNGITYLGIRGGHDIEDVEPTSGVFYTLIRSAEASGTSTDPKLVVTWTAGGATFIPKIMMS